MLSFTSNKQSGVNFPTIEFLFKPLRFQGIHLSPFVFRATLQDDIFLIPEPGKFKPLRKETTSACLVYTVS